MNDVSIFEKQDDINLFTYTLWTPKLTPLMMASMSQNFSSVKSIIGHLINNLEWTST